MILFKITGALVVLFGVVDLVGSFTGFDVWAVIGVQLPELLWRFSAYIEIAVGLLIYKTGAPKGEDEMPGSDDSDE